MKSLFYLCFITYVYCANEYCGTTKYQSRPTGVFLSNRIIGGVDSWSGSWPWMAALAVPRIRKDLNGLMQIIPHFKCGGSLISNRLVLTAAHCSKDKIYLARLGVNSLDPHTETPTDVKAAGVIKHDYFNEDTARNDIAVVVLEKKVMFTDLIRPICLPVGKMFARSSYENNYPYVVGWGSNYPDYHPSTLTLREVQMPIVNLRECQRLYKKFDNIVTNKNLCAGFSEGGMDACQGDSGGPLILRSGFENKYYIIGIVSHGKGCALPNIPGVFTRVDAYVKWLQKLIDRFDLENYFRRKILPQTFFRNQSYLLIPNRY